MNNLTVPDTIWNLDINIMWLSCTSQTMHACVSTEPVKCDHGSNENHAPWDLEWHPPYHILQLPRVGVEGRQEQLLGSPDLGHRRTWGLFSCSYKK